VAAFRVRPDGGQPHRAEHRQARSAGTRYCRQPEFGGHPLLPATGEGFPDGCGRRRAHQWVPNPNESLMHAPPTSRANCTNSRAIPVVLPFKLTQGPNQTPA
jgi:hypothetical protein